jgi:hypothetical protein
MTSKQPSDIDRLAALIQQKLDDLEARADAGEVPTAAELNAIRRLIVWVEREREFAAVRELTRST